jgi:glutamate synthase (NADPH/NADH) large chain
MEEKAMTHRTPPAAMAGAKAVRARAAAHGLYQPGREHDACGVGFIAQMKNVKSHQIVRDGLAMLENLTHRGAVGADPLMGDGAGVLVQLPDRFFREEMAEQGIELPAPGDYAVGHWFMPRDEAARAHVEEVIAEAAQSEGVPFLGFRDVPVDNASLSVAPDIAASEPVHRQAFFGRPEAIDDEDYERRLFILRKVISGRIYAENDDRDIGAYCVSLSSRTIVYKGMFLAYQVGAYYRDLVDPRFESALILVHQRFSTNTFPSWKLAHPYRMVAHNGEINTVRGNVNWMAARQASVDSELFGNDIAKLWPISYEGQSDTACFDNALEFLWQGGYSLAHAMMMLIPEAWAGNRLMNEERKAFYEYHAALMEPWDGPAAVAFTDGRQIGATLDRNGLRPARYVVTDDDRVILASEAGALPVAEEKIVKKWRLQPGRMLLIDLEQGRIVSDDEIKSEIATRHPYRQWLRNTQLILEELAPVEPRALRRDVSLIDRQQAFGYTQEDLRLLMAPMATTAQEAIGSMGTDTPIAAMSDKPKLLYDYFKQNFAQVTNPPIDPIREELVMSLVSFIGPRPNIFDLVGSSRKKRLEVRQPILTNADLEKIRSIGHTEDRFDTKTIDITYSVTEGAEGMPAAIERLCERAEAAVAGGYNIIVLSDRQIGPDRIDIPTLLATAAVHHHLIRKGLRTSVGLVVESGEPREIHHFCCLAGYGAEAINPYLAFDTLIDMHRKGQFPPEVDEGEVVSRYIKSIGKGILKVMSKMGISTYQSYCGAQIFDAVGLSSAFVDRYFTGTATTIEGIGLEQMCAETVRRHTDAFGDDPVLKHALEIGGEYLYRMRGEAHMWTPDAVANLQHAVRQGSAETFKEFSREIDGEAARARTIRGLFRLKMAGETGRQPVPLDEVEPAAGIVRRFSTGAMSFGSISREAHTTLAIAMNRIGGKSNTGEGGEEPDRYQPLPDGSSNPERSAIKQVASGRFGVTAEYLVNADVIQIKVAQGAKPGEGGQLPGHKVDATIAKTRHSTPGVGLISPPPHHDIYSIEDLAQLIYDLKNVNARADISVKLVSEVGVGTVAAGVAKARADHITIAGYDDLAEACRLALGDRPGRNPADAGAERVALQSGASGRWRLAHGPRRRHRRGSRGRRVRLRHRAADRRRLRDDAEVPSEHLPGRRRDAGPGAAQALQGRAGACRQLFLPCRGGGARTARRHGLSPARRHRRRDRPARKASDDRPLEGARARFLPPVPPAGRRPRGAASYAAPAPPDRRRARPQADRAGGAGAGGEGTSRDRSAGAQCRPLGRGDAVGRGGAALRPQGAARRHHLGEADRHRRPVLRRVPGARRLLRALGRRQRLCRQGPLGRPHRHPPAGRVADHARRLHHRRQHRALRRDRGRVLFPRRRRRALRRAQFGRGRGGRGRRRPWLRIYDRRRRRRAWPHGAQLRRRHVGRRRLCARRGRRFRRPLQHGHGRARTRAGGRRHAGKASPSWRRHRPYGQGRRFRRHDQP